MIERELALPDMLATPPGCVRSWMSPTGLCQPRRGQERLLSAVARLARAVLVVWLVTASVCGCSASVDLAAERHARAVKALINLGAEVRDVEDEVSHERGTFVYLFPEHFTHEGYLEPNVLNLVRDIRTCFLGLNNSPVKDDGLTELSRLLELRVVDLTNTRVTDRGLALLAKSRNIWLLNLNSTRISDDGLECLANMPSLRLLYLGDTSLSNAGLKHLEKLPQLEAVKLTRLSVTDDGLTSLAVLPRLRYLGLDGTLVTDTGLEHFDKLPNLIRLDVEDSAVTETAAESFRRRHPKCHVLR